MVAASIVLHFYDGSQIGLCRKAEVVSKKNAKMQRSQLQIESNQPPDSALSSTKSDTVQRLRADASATGGCLLRDNDVLSGRGSIINKHNGNLSFRRLIIANKDTYAKCEKNSHKNFLAISIIVALERKGGRFLKRRCEKIESSDWIPLSRKEAVAKTAQALRDQLQGSARKRRRPFTPVERTLEEDKGRGLYHVQRDFDNSVTSDNYDDYFTSDSSSDDTSIDSSDHVLPLRCASRPFMGFAELLAASSTMNPHSETWVSSFFHQQGVLQRQLHYRCCLSNDNSHAFEVRQQLAAEDDEENTHNEHLWVPEELQTLILSDPDAVEALSTL